MNERLARKDEMSKPDPRDEALLECIQMLRKAQPWLALPHDRFMLELIARKAETALKLAALRAKNETESTP